MNNLRKHLRVLIQTKKGGRRERRGREGKGRSTENCNVRAAAVAVLA